MGYHVRFFADAIVSLKAIANGLKAVDPTFKIDGGELTRGPELLGELEISAAPSDLFDEDLAAHVGQLERLGSPAAQQVIGRLRATRSIVTLHILDGERDPAVTWQQLGPLWTVLPSISTGLTQSDGQGFYDGSQLLVAMG